MEKVQEKLPVENNGPDDDEETAEDSYIHLMRDHVYDAIPLKDLAISGLTSHIYIDNPTHGMKKKYLPVPSNPSTNQSANLSTNTVANSLTGASSSTSANMSTNTSINIWLVRSSLY